jgi:uridine phosphorylase
MIISESELIINPDGSIYHLNLRPGDVADDVITVGDPNRVDMIAAYFDEIYLTKQNREFKTVTGKYRGKDLSVIATGIGTDNIDIVINEIDSLFNIDFNTRTINENKKSVNFYRIGTSGTIRRDISIDSFIVSQYACGIDGLLQHYDSDAVRVDELESTLTDNTPIASCYATEVSPELISKFIHIASPGITITANGFYGPQGRSLRLSPILNISEETEGLTFRNLRFTNLEMETAGIYGLSHLLGHKAVSLNAILANRVTGEFSSQPHKTIQSLIEITLERI